MELAGAGAAGWRVLRCVVGGGWDGCGEGEERRTTAVDGGERRMSEEEARTAWKR